MTFNASETKLLRELFSDKKRYLKDRHKCYSAQDDPPEVAAARKVVEKWEKAEYKRLSVLRDRIDDLVNSVQLEVLMGGFGKDFSAALAKLDDWEPT